VDSQPSANDLQREIVALVGELEELCARAERQLVALNWDDLQGTISDQRRVTQALINAIYATSGQRSDHFNKQLERHVLRIYAVRDNQLKRMQAFRDNVRARLRVIAKAKQASRSFGGRTRTPSAGLDLLR
jgi:hypothetical protein